MSIIRIVSTSVFLLFCFDCISSKTYLVKTKDKNEKSGIVNKKGADYKNDPYGGVETPAPDDREELDIEEPTTPDPYEDVETPESEDPKELKIEERVTPDPYKGVESPAPEDPKELKIEQPVTPDPYKGTDNTC